MTGTVFGLSVVVVVGSGGVGVEVSLRDSVLPNEEDPADSEDLTETIRGASRATDCAGMGVVEASSHWTSLATESRMREGEMDFMVYCVSRLPAV